jgi:hypothetical protein
MNQGYVLSLHLPVPRVCSLHHEPSGYQTEDERIFTQRRVLDNKYGKFKIRLLIELRVPGLKILVSAAGSNSPVLCQGPQSPVSVRRSSASHVSPTNSRCAASTAPKTFRSVVGPIDLQNVLLIDCGNLWEYDVYVHLRRTEIYLRILHTRRLHVSTAELLQFKHHEITENESATQSQCNRMVMGGYDTT